MVALGEGKLVGPWRMEKEVVPPNTKKFPNRLFLSGGMAPLNSSERRTQQVLHEHRIYQ